MICTIGLESECMNFLIINFILSIIFATVITYIICKKLFGGNKHDRRTKSIED